MWAASSSPSSLLYTASRAQSLGPRLEISKSVSGDVIETLIVPTAESTNKNMTMPDPQLDPTPVCRQQRATCSTNGLSLFVNAHPTAAQAMLARVLPSLHRGAELLACYAIPESLLSRETSGGGNVDGSATPQQYGLSPSRPAPNIVLPRILASEHHHCPRTARAHRSHCQCTDRHSVVSRSFKVSTCFRTTQSATACIPSRHWRFGAVHRHPRNARA